ncbi:hypothetical protein H2198_002824 [Neophaeococcomyces mojaviensis]|uniref:Uncharacterized protein n=1 Tax=Neophaeococcomyces mojaviensis TaxID=3383035 RepID=A0ACC3ACY1_9EURO|nr:hypothetical protein H2198_002824 [Knufia sp. JES_112]
MLVPLLSAVALATAVSAAEVISPLFFLSSTAQLDLPTIPDSSPVNDIHHAFSRAVSSCPTKHYAVVYQPGVTNADYESSYLPIGVHTHTNLIAEKIQGTVDVVAVVNTILMDCLHHGVTKVESLDTSELKVEDMSEEKIRDSIMHVSLPTVNAELSKKERSSSLQVHDDYIKRIVGKYFDNKDYTLIYITEAAKETEERLSIQHEENAVDGAEVPFVLEEEV